MIICRDHVPDLILRCRQHEVNGEDLHQVRLHCIYASGTKTLGPSLRAQEYIHLSKRVIIVVLRDQLSHPVTLDNCDGVFSVIEQQRFNATGVISIYNPSPRGNTLFPSQTTTWCNTTLGSRG